MKRKLALLLALVMVISMLPMTAFAASTNSVTRVPLVAENTTFTVDNAPVLRIAESNKTWRGLENEVNAQTFRLNLQNAEWHSTVTNLVYDNGYDNGIEKIQWISKSTIQVTTKAGEDVALLPMRAKVLSGEATVTVDPRDSAVTGGTYTFARTSAGKAVVSIEDYVTFGAEGVTELETIEIEETAIGAYAGTKTVRMVLPRDFNWEASKVAATFEADHVTYAGGFIGNAEVTKVVVDKELLEITFKIEEGASTRGSIFLDLEISATSRAPYGDVNVRVSGRDLETQTLKVAEYTDYAVIAKKASGDVPELFAGRLDLNDVEVHELKKLIIEEKVEGSWLNRSVMVQLPEWVKIVGLEVNKFEGFESVSTDELSTEEWFMNNVDENELEFRLNANSDVLSKLELTFLVSIRPNAEGDITAAVSGRGIGVEFDVLLGEALAPVTVETTTTEILVGKQNQAIGEVTITETVEGALIEGETVLVQLPTDFSWRVKPTVEVVEGDLRIKSVDTDGNKLTFVIDRQSFDEPAVIKITEGSVTINRVPADGPYSVRVGGSAIVQNNESTAAKDKVTAFNGGTQSDDLEDAILWDNNWIATKTLFNVVATLSTPEVKLTIGSTTFTVGGAVETLPVAPYIDAQNRTMVPLSTVGRILGADVDWNAEHRTVLITRGSDRVLLTIGSDVMNVNGMMIPMRSEAVITADRTFVPLRDLGVALGVSTDWDAATRTITVK